VYAPRLGESTAPLGRFDEAFVVRQKAWLEKMKGTLLRELGDVNKDEWE
jgi:hypothetical protein